MTNATIFMMTSMAVKVAFWAYVYGTRRDIADEDRDELDDDA